MSGNPDFLEVTFVGCRNLKSTELFTKQDPYVVVNYGEEQFRTETHDDGGKDPVWNETFDFKLIPGLNDYNIVIWNENVIKDDIIGTANINFGGVLQNGFLNEQFSVMDRKGRPRGTIHIIMRFPSTTPKAMAELKRKEEGIPEAPKPKYSGSGQNTLTAPVDESEPPPPESVAPPSEPFKGSAPKKLPPAEPEKPKKLKFQSSKPVDLEFELPPIEFGEFDSDNLPPAASTNLFCCTIS